MLPFSAFQARTGVCSSVTGHRPLPGEISLLPPKAGLTADGPCRGRRRLSIGAAGVTPPRMAPGGALGCLKLWLGGCPRIHRNLFLRKTFPLFPRPAFTVRGRSAPPAMGGSLWGRTPGGRQARPGVSFTHRMRAPPQLWSRVQYNTVHTTTRYPSTRGAKISHAK